MVTPPSAGRGSGSLEAAESAFVAASLRGGPRAGYQAYSSDRILLYRDDQAPMQGRVAALGSPAPPEGATVWLADRVAPYQRPRRIHVMELPTSADLKVKRRLVADLLR